MSQTEAVASGARKNVMPAAESERAMTKGLEIEEGRMLITPGVATAILELYPYENQRRVTKDHVARLASEMTHGVWAPGSQIAFGVLPDQSKHLINGHHRLSAIMESGTTQQFQILLLRVKNKEELATLYHRFDTVQRGRSDGAMLRSSLMNEKAAVPWELGAAALTAATIIKIGMRFPYRGMTDPYLRTPDGKLEAAEVWWPYVRTYAKITDSAERGLRRSLRQSAVLSVAIVTLRYQREKATAFWQGISDNDGLRKGDPRRTLAMTLIDRNFSGAPRDCGIVLATKAWNAWYQDENCALLRYDANFVPRILGTPFAKLK